MSEGKRLNEAAERRFEDSTAADWTLIAKILLQFRLGQVGANQLASRAAPSPFGLRHFAAR